MKTKFATVLLSTCLLASFSGSAFAQSSPAPELPAAANDAVILTSPGLGFPLADGVDELASTNTRIETYSIDAEGRAVTRSNQSYSSSGFSSGVYIGGSSKPTIFSLNSVGYAEYSSIYQDNVNPGESVQITYQTLDANNGSVLAGKNLSGVQSTGKVVLTTKVQKNTAVNAYLNNFTGNKTAVSGTFNW
ncbi:hypothetical protein ACK8P5_05975 [Paenibacillus sp. EC2-1]|uniref:hypothetical protein n=1 Tax=Paenibacillus sp. EC2-1 TaxID=3388665 RepID=UPI003BEEE766